MDMLHGVADLFCTGVECVRLSGEITWTGGMGETKGPTAEEEAKPPRVGVT
jgi:hypothetical protein